MIKHKKLFKPRRLIGNIAYYVSQLLQCSLRLQVQVSKNYDPNTQYLFAFWHGKQFLPVIQLHQHHHTQQAALVSPSKDGDLLAYWLEKLGYTVVRGSARDRSVASALAMLRKLRQGYSLGFGIDGPTGPIYTVKPGMAFLAQKSGVAIVPLGSAYARKWIFSRAWDKYQLPRPFVKAVYCIGDPIHVAADADLAEVNVLLESALHKVEGLAEQLLKPKYD